MGTHTYELLIKLSVLILLPILVTLATNILLELSKKRTSTQEIKKGIISELKELQIHISNLCFQFTMESGIVTKEWANWMKPYDNLLHSSTLYDYTGNVLSTEDDAKWINLTGDELFDWLNTLIPVIEKTKSHSEASPEVTLSLPKISMYYTESNIGLLALYGELLQQKILILKREINNLNFLSEQLWYYHTKIIEGTNRKTCITNIQELNDRVAKRTRYIVTQIQNILDEFDKMV